MNKKGFTLIEMLVVIAIIAILVAIIIPVVGNSTVRAAAATDAANLRAAQATLSIAYMNGVEMPANGNEMPADYGTTPKAKSKGAGDFSYTIDTYGEVIVKFGDKTILEFADIADNGKVDNTAGDPGTGGSTPGSHQHSYSSEVLPGNKHKCTGCDHTVDHSQYGSYWCDYC